MIEFFITCVPPTANHQNKKIVRVGKWHHIADADELVAAKEMLDNLLLPHQPAAPLAGVLQLTLDFTWPWLKSHSKKIRARGRIRKATNPDSSNLAKTTEDRLAALRFIADDGMVSDLHVRKWFGDQPGINVRIETLSEDLP